ncbi:MAG: hypothetical protein H7Z10_00340 [Gemmatimonadaceae bacterium]|nr:hypothetical protein [Acetobacteraceae bacterium]
MTKIDLAFAHGGAVGQRRYREIDVPAPPVRDHLELVGLYAAIEAALPAGRGMVVQLVSSEGKEGCSDVAAAAGWVAVALLGKRVLVLDDAADSRRSLPGPHEAGLSLPELRLPDQAKAAEHTAAPEQVIAKVRGMDLYLAPLRNGLMQTTPLAAAKGFASLLDGLRPVFDLILVVPRPMGADPFGRVFARHIDGTVLVVEAERTRGAAAAAMVDQISAAGGVVLGSVLNRRRHHIPRWLRRSF